MRNPQESAEVDEIIGRLLKASGKVRRGIGSVRQDVNVSINGGTRVEIKGVAKTGYIHNLTWIEALRQQALLDIKAEIQARGISRKGLVLTNHDLTSALSSTASPTLQEALKSGFVIKCAKLKGFAGLLNHPTQPGLTFASEYAGRIRVIACLDKMPNIFHSDAPDESDLSSEEWAKIKDIAGCKLTDSIIVVWGSEEDVETALEEIKFRTLDAIRGVPNETRQDVKRGGVTDFERILPGPDRMYPDTDLPPLAIREDRLKRIENNLPEKSYDKEKRWRNLGVKDEIIKPLAISDKASVFDRIITGNKVDPNSVGVVLTQTLKSLRRKGFSVEKINDDNLVEMFSLYSEGRFAREALPKILEKLCNSPDNKPVMQILDELNFLPVSEDEAKEFAIEEIEKADSIQFKSDQQRLDYLMGEIMRKLRGRIAGEKARQILRDIIS